MAGIKKNDFVELEYTGRVKEDNTIFDTTEEKVAKAEGVYDKEHIYKPLIICIGQNNMPKAFEESLMGKEKGKEYTLEISAENAFGRKDARMIQLIPLSKFRQQNINPVPGLHLNIDGVFGVVRSAGAGRCYVDFNHPLAGKDLIYEVKVIRIVEGDKEKLKALLDLHFHMHDAQIELNDGNAIVKIKHNVPKEALEETKKIMKVAIPNVENIEFKIENTAQENK